jgi:hypothetical protein
MFFIIVGPDVEAYGTILPTWNFSTDMKNQLLWWLEICGFFKPAKIMSFNKK